MSEGIHITLVRHGESESNRLKRWQGQGDSPLSETGRAQASAVGRRLARRSFDRVVSSDLQRASDTARASGFAVETFSRLREFDVGEWEGLTREEVEQRYPDEMQALADGQDIPLGGGETHGEFSERIDAALEWLLGELDPGQRLLVVCHGGVIGAALSGLLNLRGRSRWPFARVTNTSVSEIEWRPEGSTLQVFNDDLHTLGMPAQPMRPVFGVPLGMGVQSRQPDGLAHLADWGATFEAIYDLADDAGRGSARGLNAQRPEDAAIGRLHALPEGDARLEAFEEWLGIAARRHASEGAAMVAPAAVVQAWAERVLWHGEGAKGALAAASDGSCARARVTEGQTVVDSYNADGRR